MKKGRPLGITLLVVGILFIGVNYFLIYNATFFFPKMILIGFPTSMLGLAMILFQGGDFSAEIKVPKPKEMFKNAPLLHKLMWILFTLVGLIIGIWWGIDYGIF
jgi:hypothetical protein